MSSTYTTFAAAQEAFLQHCGIPKELIETSISEVEQGMQNAQMRMDGKTTYIMFLGGTGGSNLKIFISHKDNESATFLSDFSAAEKTLIESAAPLHPAGIPTIILKNVTTTLSHEIKDIHELVNTIAPSKSPHSMSQQLWDIAKSINTYKRQVAQLKNATESIQKLLGHFDKQYDVQQTLEDQLSNVLLRLEHCGSILAETKSNITAYKDWLDAQVSKSQHLMAIDGWKDGKSSYIISFMSLVFWPGTFISLFFSNPFFNWDVAYGEEIINPRFKYYQWGLFIISLVSFSMWWIGSWLAITFSDIHDEEEEEKKAD